jgi:cytochrome b6-f complex iron-sulfur subunit
MSNAAIVAVAVVAVVVLAIIAFVTTQRRSDARRGAGALSRETVRRDRSALADAPVPPSGRSVERAAAEARSPSTALATLEPRHPAPYVPPDPETIGFTRRQFFNRGMVTLMSVGLGGFGLAVIGFLWPKLSGGGFGGKIPAGKIEDIKASIRAGNGFYYLAAARTWMTEYPPESLEKASKVYSGAVLNGMENGLNALYQKCPHLGCRVPQCVSSQWFECPCHGSQYNQVGEKKGGPAPRGMDRWGISVSGGNVVVDTSPSSLVQGPPIGTNTTGQEAEGPHCITGGSAAAKH